MLIIIKFKRVLTKFCAISGCLVLLSSCGDMFSTEPVTSRPDDINQYNELFKLKEKINYRLQEWVVHENSDSLQVTNQKLEFKYIGESQIDNLDWSLFSMTVSDFNSGEELYSKTFTGRLDSAGARFFPDSSKSGPRFFLLRTSVKPSQKITEFETLPSLLLSGSQLNFSNGILTFERTITGLDTLQFRGRLEEAWLVSETVFFEGELVLEASYAYAESGLLSCTQVFPGFEHRSGFGVDFGSGRIKRVFTLL